MIQARITCKKNSFISLLNSAWFLSKAQLDINKKQKTFSRTNHQLAENLILVFCFYERTKMEKIEFVTKFVGTIGTIIFQ